MITITKLLNNRIKLKKTQGKKLKEEENKQRSRQQSLWKKGKSIKERIRKKKNSKKEEEIGKRKKDLLQTRLRSNAAGRWIPPA